jgi:hypothetical protein
MQPLPNPNPNPSPNHHPNPNPDPNPDPDPNPYPYPNPWTLNGQKLHLAAAARGRPDARPRDLLPAQLLRVEQPQVVVVPARGTMSVLVNKRDAQRIDATAVTHWAATDIPGTRQHNGKE